MSPEKKSVFRILERRAVTCFTSKKSKWTESRVGITTGDNMQVIYLLLALIPLPGQDLLTQRIVPEQHRMMTGMVGNHSRAVLINQFLHADTTGMRKEVLERSMFSHGCQLDDKPCSPTTEFITRHVHRHRLIPVKLRNNEMVIRPPHADLRCTG